LRESTTETRRHGERRREPRDVSLFSVSSQIRMLRMRPRLFSIALQAIAAACLFAVGGSAQTQDTATGTATASGVILAKLSPPIYPPLARQARITGDVEVRVSIRKDGSVEAAYVVSGHPMLREAALRSALRSTFECSGCSDLIVTDSLTYTFGLREDVDGLDCGITRSRGRKCLYLWACGLWHRNTRNPAVGRSLDHVMILADPTCIDTTTGS